MPVAIHIRVIVIVNPVPSAIVVPMPSIMRIFPAMVLIVMTLPMLAPMMVLAIVTTVSVIASVDIVVVHVGGAETNSEFRIAMFGVGW